MSNEVRKKVSPFPIPVQLLTAVGPVQGQLVKLTLQGFLAEMPIMNVQPGETLEITFEIPVTHAVVKQHCVLVKIYSHWGSATHNKSHNQADNSTKPAPAVDSHLTLGSPKAEGLSVLQLVEVHFQPLQEPGRSAIIQFMKLIKQVV